MTYEICQTQKDRCIIISHTQILGLNFIHVCMCVVDQKGSMRNDQTLRWRREDDRILWHDSRRGRCEKEWTSSRGVGTDENDV